MRASRGMGAINPAKMPKAKTVYREDNPDAVDMYAEGGKVNAAGNYTKPELRKRIVSQVKSAATHGTGAGQWSARKAQLVAKKYKAAGGGYK
jgi:alanine-alpha-ketoisovalerate/valine-pyruvate aminotransferase